MNNKVFISCAVTGSGDTASKHPDLPKTPQQIATAAIEAAKLGINLGDLTGIADGLLNIEDSLASQFEFQAMTGKQINLDKARELALAGDLAGMAKEISKEAGTDLAQNSV